MNHNPSAPLNDTIITAVSQLIDDAQLEKKRDPSHSDIEFIIKRHGLITGDPKNQGQNVGKAKRIRATLNWAIEKAPQEGGELVYALISSIQGHGGFRTSSPNYVGSHQIQNAIMAFDKEGYELTLDGNLSTKLLNNLSGAALTDALKVYVQRAKRGSTDAALVVGTSKDLLEAVAAHILQQRQSTYSSTANFSMLLGQTFIALGLLTPQHPVQPNEPPNARIERAMFELACGINQLRNKQGTGHGRPWLSTVTDAEAKMAIETMGIIAERLLSLHLGIK